MDLLILIKCKNWVKRLQKNNSVFPIRLSGLTQIGELTLIGSAILKGSTALIPLLLRGKREAPLRFQFLPIFQSSPFEPMLLTKYLHTLIVFILHKIFSFSSACVLPSEFSFQ